MTWTKHFQSVSRLFFNHQRTQKVRLPNHFQSVAKNGRFQRKAGNWKREERVINSFNTLISIALTDFYMICVIFPGRDSGNALEMVN